MDVTFNYVESKSEDLHVVCDTNVWYNIANGTFTKPENISLIPTLLTLVELSTSETMASAINLFQNVIRSVYENSGPIIPLNPFDFVLKNHDENYPFHDDTAIKNVLKAFSLVLSKEVPENTILTIEDRNKLIESCKEDRKPTVEFARFGNENLEQIRTNINKGVGKKEHSKIDTKDINREMVKSILSDHAQKVNYTIDFENFDWTQIEFFMVVTENYFRKLETTKGMKIQPNDAVDWFNMLYVTPKDKYLTFEKSWRKIIQDDERTSTYLFS